MIVDTDFRLRDAGPPAAADERAPAAEPRGATRLIRSEQLFAGANEVLVEHGDAVYRLRRTALGKLILTK